MLIVFTHPKVASTAPPILVIWSKHMDVETWKEVWKLVFIASSVAFYAVVIAVAFMGFGDVAQMLRNMAAAAVPASRLPIPTSRNAHKGAIVSRIFCERLALRRPHA